MALPQAGVQLIAEGAGEFLSTMQKGAKGVTDLGDAAEKAGGGFSSFGQIAIGALREVGAMAVNVAASAGKALIGFMGDSISVAGDFEAGMNKFSAAAGDGLEAAGLKASDFRDIFLDIGARLPVSTAEVQDAATTLIKGGIDPLILKMGGLESSIQFAAAAGMGLNEAAELSIKQLGTFVPITASAAEQTKFLAEAQDLLVKAAGASTLDVDKLGAAMLGAGGQAKAMGVEYQDFVTTMGLISPSFSSAETAGTSYKNFLIRLIPTTKNATAMMKDLGLMTEEGKNRFFDATGAYVGNQQAAEMLQYSLRNLTAEQRTHALQTIFGNDAMGAAIALADGGGEAYAAFAAKMAAANGVTAQAATVQQGYNIAMDNFKGSVESLQITIGSLLLPLLTTLFNTVLAPAVNTVTTLTNALTGNQAAFAALSPTLQSVVLGIQALPAVLAGLIAQFQSMAPAAAGFAAALLPLGAQIMGVFTQVQSVAVGAINAIVTGVQMSAPQLAAGFAAYQANVGIVAGVFTSILGIASSVLAQIASAINTHGAGMVASLASWWSQAQQTVATLLGGLASLIQPILAQIKTFIDQNGADIAQTFATVWGQITDITQTALAILNATVVPAITAIFGAVGAFITAHGAEIQSILSNSWKAISTIITTTLAAIQGAIKAVLQIIQGDWEGAWNTMKATGETVLNGIITVAQSILSNLVSVVSLALQATLDAILGFVGSFSSAGADLIRGMVDGIKSAAGAVASAAVQVVKDAISAAKAAAGISSPSKRANIEIGQPFTQGIAQGVLQAKPVVTQAASSIATHLTRETRKNAIDGGGMEKGGSRGIGRDFVAGIAEGLSKAVSGGGLKVGADKVAGGMLSTVKSPLGIASPSTEAAKQIGNPFVRGIIEGVLKAAPDLFKALAKTAKDMLQVFEGLGDKIGKAIQDALTARADMMRDAGNAWSTLLGTIDPQSAIDAAQRVTDLVKEQADAQIELTNIQRERDKHAQEVAQQIAEQREAGQLKLIDLQAEYNRDLQHEQATIRELEDDRQDQLAKAKTDAQRAQINEEFNERRLKVEARIAEINRKYTADQQDAQRSLAGLEAERQRLLNEGLNESNEKREQITARIAELEAKIATAKREQAIADEILMQKRRRSQEAQNAMRELGTEAAKIADPRKRADFLRMRERQIQEVLDAQQALYDARQAVATEGGDAFFEAQQLEAAGLRLNFILQAQEAERAAFNAGLLTTLDEGGQAIGDGIVQAVLGSLGTIGTQFATVLAQALGTVRIEGRAAGGPVSGGTPYMVGERGPELFLPQRSGRIQPLARPAQMARAAMGGNTYGGATYQLNVTTQQSVGSIRAEFGLMQVMAGAS